MFRPRHAYRSPVTNRYRGRAKGCPVFNNIVEIDSHMVEQHDECLECLAKLKNRTELYRTLSDNNKPSNNVIKSLQRLSSSASNNRLKTCLQFHIIKVNEKSIPTPTQQAPPTLLNNGGSSPKVTHSISNRDILNMHQQCQMDSETTILPNTRHSTKRQKAYLNRNKIQRQKHNQLASPPQDQVSSTQDGQLGPTKDDHDCQTSPPMLTTTHTEEQLTVTIDNKSSDDDDDSPRIIKTEKHKDFLCAQTTQSSPCNNSFAIRASTNETTGISTSPRHTPGLNESQKNIATIISDTKFSANSSASHAKCQTTKPNSVSTSTTTTTDLRLSPITKRRRTQNSLGSDPETSSVASWSLASYAATSPPSPISSASSTSSISSASSSSSSSFRSSSSCLSSSRQSPSPTPSSPELTNELKGPRLKLSEQKIRKIKKKPLLFDELFYLSDQPSVASTPTTSSGCSPGQHSNTTQNSEQGFAGRNLSFIANNTVSHMFQAPPTFINNLKPCNLPEKPQNPQPISNSPVPTKVAMINCAICGIKAKPPNISKIYNQYSCTLCMKFFEAFLERPRQLYCAHDGDCLMTFDSRCQACWIKICLQKFNIDEEHRKIGHNYSPKLLSSPSVSLITIDTSINS